MAKLTIYEKAFMLANQFGLTLMLSPDQTQGLITITPKDVIINPKDRPKEVKY